MSIEAKLVQSVLKIFRVKRWLYRDFLKPGRQTGTLTIDKFSSDLEIKNLQVDGFNLVTVNQPVADAKHVVFLPGGAYIKEANPFHRQLIEKLALENDLAITCIDYPKAPEYNYQTTHQVVLKAYLEIVQRNPSSQIILLGDSAGGGLALSLLQTLRDSRIRPFPEKTILISPWLDLSMSHPRIQEYETRDHLLPLNGLRYAAKVYSGGEDLKNPLLSPLYGEMVELGKILLMFASEELFYPDCQKLTEKLVNAKGTTVDTVVGEGMFHDWVIFPTKNSRQDFTKLVDFIQDIK